MTINRIDIAEATNAILLKARSKAAESMTEYSDAYTLGYFSAFIENFLTWQPEQVKKDFLEAVKNSVDLPK